MTIKRENEVELKDGRKLFTTGNGFRYHLVDQKGIETEVSSNYYNKAIKNTITTLPYRKRRKKQKIYKVKKYVRR